MTQLVDFSNTVEVVVFTLMLCLIVFLRYVLVCGFFFVFFNLFFKTRFLSRRISHKLRPEKQHWKEIKMSAITSVIFALAGVGMVWLWQNGHTAIYTDPEQYGAGWFVASILLLMFVHEGYYYWLHRWMHKPGIYRRFHKTHHDSIVTSPWTAFSFHPVESVLQALFVPVMVVFVPMHVAAILSVLTIMTISAAINHLDIEIYPKNFENHWLGKWLIGATHHSLHHSQFRFNYGLYFTFWDKWMKTESPDFKTLFRKKTQP